MRRNSVTNSVDCKNGTFLSANTCLMSTISLTPSALSSSAESAAATNALHVVGGVPAVVEVRRLGGQQDRRFELPRMHVVVAAARDAGGLACFGPVFAARVQADADRTVCVRLLNDIGQDVISSVSVDEDEAADPLLRKRCGDIGNDSGECGRADTHRAREPASAAGRSLLSRSSRRRGPAAWG